MKKYALATILFTIFVIPACSDDSSKQECPPQAECQKCETCQECQQCPTCKEGDECPAPSCPTCPTCKEGDECPAPSCPTCPTCKEGDECPAPSCPSCPTCKEGDECPACPAPSCPTCPTCKEGDECPACNCKECDECKECPECNTDALNSQLTSCNNELTTTKQALETEKSANESCVGDLDNCNKDLSELSAKPRSKSGSRLIFKEHKMSDGSVYVEPYPYDTKFGKYVYMGLVNNISCFINIADANVAITNYNQRNIALEKPSDFNYSYNKFYLDSECTTTLNQEINDNYLFVESNSGVLKTGDIYVELLFKNNYGTLSYNAKKVTINRTLDNVYYNYGDGCKISNHPGKMQIVSLSDTTEEQIRSYFVCEE